jgi:hypothetical protein
VRGLTLRDQALIGQGAAAPAWTPADIDGISLKAWYDASDTATITDAGAGAVSAWGDKSSNNFDLTQGTGGLRPTTAAATLNSLNVITFAADYMAAGSAADWKFLHDGTEHTVCAVVKFGTSTTPSTGYGLFGTNGTASASIGATLYFEDSAGVQEDNIVHQVTRGVGSSFVTRNVSIDTRDFATPNEWLILSLMADGNAGTAAGRSDFRINRGHGVAANGDTNAVSSSNPTHALSLGSCANTVYPLTGAIAEIVFTTAWADRLLIERYLAAKWGIAPYRLDSNGPITVEAA